MPIHYDDTRRAEARAAFNKSVKDLFGFGAEHLVLTYSTWNLSTWNDEDIPEIINKPQSILATLDRIWQEIAWTDRNTTISPCETRMSLGLPIAPVECRPDMPNIMTTSGMIEMANRGPYTHDGTSGTTHGAVGRGTTSEKLSDIKLEDEIDRKAYSTDGKREVAGTTERYGLPFSRTDFAADEVVTEAAMFTAASDGHCIARVVSNGVTVSTGRTMTMQTNITHINGTQF